MNLFYLLSAICGGVGAYALSAGYQIGGGLIAAAIWYFGCGIERGRKP